MIALFSLANLSCFLVRILQHIFVILASLINIGKSSKPSNVGSDELKFEHRLSPLLVPVPLYLTAKSTKEHLPVSKYSQVFTGSPESLDENCVVCLAAMKDDNEVRRLPNCGHVFHKDCIDAWIDKCKSTCPVCRSGLLMDPREKFRCGEDPWRKERMIYLFGEDYLM